MGTGTLAMGRLVIPKSVSAVCQPVSRSEVLPAEYKSVLYSDYSNVLSVSYILRSFIKKYLLSIYYIPGYVLAFRIIAAKKKRCFLPSWR